MTDDKSFAERVNEIRERRGDRYEFTLDGGSWGTVWYTNTFEEHGKITGYISISTFATTDRPAVHIHREDDCATVLHLDDVQRIDFDEDQ